MFLSLSEDVYLRDPLRLPHQFYQPKLILATSVPLKPGFSRSWDLFSYLSQSTPPVRATTSREVVGLRRLGPARSGLRLIFSFLPTILKRDLPFGVAVNGNSLLLSIACWGDLIPFIGNHDYFGSCFSIRFEFITPPSLPLALSLSSMGIHLL